MWLRLLKLLRSLCWRNRLIIIVIQNIDHHFSFFRLLLSLFFRWLILGFTELQNIENWLFAIQINRIIILVPDPFIRPINLDSNFTTSAIVNQHPINKDIHIRFKYFCLADRTIPLSCYLMIGYQCLKANYTEMFTVSATNRYPDSLFGVWTHQVHFVLKYFDIRLVLVQ